MKLRLTQALACASLAALPLLVQAQPTAHYAPGIEGIKAASLPPPGIYLRDYNLFYFAGRLNDNHGDKISGADPEAFIYAQVPRLVWITPAQILGGYIGVDALLPFQQTSLKVNTPGGKFDDSTFNMGDAFTEVTWSAHAKHWDVSAGFGVWFPTGNSSPTLSTEPGLGYFTYMFTAGVTWYPDAEKLWSVSVLNRYEINTEKDDTEITPGNAYTVEGGISRVLGKGFEVGAVGYYQQQVTDDSGRGAGDAHDRVAGVGPEVTMFCNHLGLATSLRYLYEFMAENRLQGHTVALTFTKRF